MLLSPKLFSQYFEFNHSAGTTIIVGFLKIDNEFKFKNNLGVTFNPRLDYIFNENLSLGVSLYPTMAFAGNSNYNSDSPFNFTFESPILVQFNIGNDASAFNDSELGGFFGGGINLGIYSNFGTDGTYSDEGELNIKNGRYASLCWNVGLKYQKFGFKFQWSKVIGIEDFYKVNIFGISILYNFE